MENTLNQPRRVLFLDHTPFIGGAQLAVIEFIKKTDRTKIEAVIVNSLRAEELGLTSEYKKNNLKYYLIPFFNLRRRGFFGIFYLISDLRKTLNIIRREKIELIFSNTVRADILGALAALISRRPLIWYLLDYTFPRPLFNILKIIPQKIFYVSRSVGEYYEADLQAAESVFYLWSSILEKFQKLETDSREKMRRLLNINPNDFLAVYLGRLVENKGPQVLISALKELKSQGAPVKGLIVGTGRNQEGDNEQALQDLVKKYSLEKEVVFLGLKPDITPYLVAADVLCLTTIAPEPYSSVVLEAMFGRVPVVATDTGGTAEINEPEEICLVIPPNNSAALIQAIDKFRLGNSLKQEMVEKAYRQVANNNSAHQAAHRWENIFLKIISHTH